LFVSLACERGSFGWLREISLVEDRKMPGLPWDNSSWDVAANIVAARSRQNAADFMAGTSRTDTPLPLRVAAQNTQLLMQAVVVPGERTEEGRLIEAVTIPWFDIIDLLKQDPNVAFQISPERWEEMIAEAYHKSGFEEVTLTPRSGDRGRDVIAIKKGLGIIRVIDQVKAFKPPYLVTANDVRALVGVLSGDGASKGFLTTTSDFAPNLRTDPLIACHIPARLGLVNGTMLMERLKELGRK
jgi:restriction system protein